MQKRSISLIAVALLGSAVLAASLPPSADAQSAVTDGQSLAVAFRALTFESVFAGVSPDGESIVWEGRAEGVVQGRVTVELTQVEPPSEAANPVWYVRARWTLATGDARSFVADLKGIVDWKAGLIRLAGTISSGAMSGAWVEQEGRVVDGDISGGLMIVPPAEVRAGPVSQEPLAPPVVESGTLGSNEEIPLSFRIGGVVERVFVDAGAVVRAGDPLATLDLHEFDAAVARARSAADKAGRDLGRVLRLFADRVATLEQVRRAATAREVALAALEAATLNRRKAAIVAPAAGVILRRSAEPGELVAPGATVLVLASRARGSVIRP